MLPVNAKAALNARIRAVQDSGYGDIGIAILPTIGDFPPFEVGLAIYRIWRIGRVETIGAARRDLGVLLLIVPKELSPDKKGQCWITTGTGAEGIITDAASGGICTDRVIPFLRTRDYSAALAAGVEGIAERLHGDAALAPPDSGPPPGPGEPIPILEEPKTGVRWWHMVGGGFLLASLIPAGLRWRRHRPRRCPKCRMKMQRLTEKMDDQSLEPGQQMEEGLRSVDYDVWSCACGESLVLPYQAVLTKYKACPECHRRTATVTRRVTKQPTHTARGEAKDTTTCKFCRATSTKFVSLPKRTPRSTSASSGGRSSSSSSSGGSSFGGSGSSSGGGGGSSYQEETMRSHFFIAVLLATCTAPTSGVPLEQDFELRPGQTVKIVGTGHTVTFEAVTEDSRCPAGVQCVWAGNARVSLRLGEAGRDTVLALNTGIEPRVVGIGKISLELKAVTPGPNAGTATPASTYRVTLRATGA